MPRLQELLLDGKQIYLFGFAKQWLFAEQIDPSITYSESLANGYLSLRFPQSRTLNEFLGLFWHVFHKMYFNKEKLIVLATLADQESNMSLQVGPYLSTLGRQRIEKKKIWIYKLLLLYHQLGVKLIPSA